MKTRNCRQCGKSEHMTRIVDDKYEIYDIRHYTCYQCHPELDSSAINNSGKQGGLKEMRSYNMGMGDIYCEEIERTIEEEHQEDYIGEDTILDFEEEAI